MTPMADIEWGACALEPQPDPGLEREVRKAVGFVPPMVHYFTGCPWIVRAMIAFDESQLGLRHVDVELSSMIALVVSQDNSCRYCYTASRALLEIIGVPGERARQLEQGLLAGIGPESELALEFVRQVSRANPIPIDGKSRLEREGVDAAMIKELAFLAAVHGFYNRLATLPALPLEPVEKFVNSLMMKLMRPLVALQLRRRHHRPAALLEGQAVDAPYGYLVAAFADLPAGRSLDSVLRGLWQSPTLPRRVKALAFAIISRGLGCELSEREARRILGEEGMVASEIDDVLTHLSSPSLSESEAAVARFARATIWYQPAQIQRQAREVQEQLRREQFVELIGVTSLANAVCRMSVVLS